MNIHVLYLLQNAGNKSDMHRKSSIFKKLLLFKGNAIVPNIPIRLTLGKCIILLSQATMRQLDELKQGQLHVLALLPELMGEK